MAMEQYFCYAADFDGVLIDAVSEQSVDGGANIIRPQADGLAFPKRATVNTIDQTYGFKSNAIATMLGALSATVPQLGKEIKAGDELTMFLQRQTNMATRDGATSHLKIVVNTGFIYTSGFSAENENPGTVDAAAIVFSETQTASQSLAGTPAADEEFYAGPVKLNNVALDGVQSINCVFGQQLDIKREAGSARPVFVGVNFVSPVISFTTTNAGLYNTYAGGVAISSATHFYLRKGSPTVAGGRVADITAEHIKCTINAGMIKAAPMSGNQQMLTLEIHPIFDGTNAILIFDLASAIT
jgi:hypothetical protein